MVGESRRSIGKNRGRRHHAGITLLKQTLGLCSAWQFSKFFYIHLFNLISTMTPILRIQEPCLLGTKLLSHRQAVNEWHSEVRSRPAGLGWSSPFWSFSAL